MHIKHAVFKNFGPHRHLAVDFTLGLVGIFGPNGRGKSHVVDGIFAALTNDFSRFPGVKEDCVNLLAPPEEESSIYVEGEHNGVPFTLIRVLRREKKRGSPDTCLLVGDGKPITKAPDIERELAERLGVNKALVSRYVFVRQWDMFAFLTATPGDRAASYQMLCGTGKAATVYAAADDLLAAEPVADDAGLVDDSDEIRRRLAEIDAEHEGTSEERERAAAGLLPEERRQKAENVRRQRERYDALTQERFVVFGRVEARAGRLESQRLDYADKQNKLEAAKAKADRLRPENDRARDALRQLAQYAKTQARRRQVQAELAGLKDPGPATKLEADDARSQNYAEHLAEFRETLRRDEGILAKMRETGLTECPTCGTPVSTLGEHLHAIEEGLLALRDAVKDLTDALNRIEASRRRFIASDQAYKNYLGNKARLESALDDLAVAAPVVDQNTSALQATIETFELAERDHVVAVNLHNVATREVATAEANHQAAVNRLNELDGQLIQNAVSNELYARVTAALATHEAARVNVATLDERLRRVVEQRRQDEERLASLTTRLERGRKSRAFADRVRQVKAVMHRQALPAVVAQANLRDMEDQINRELGDFGNPFWVEASDELSFRCHFPGMPPVSDQKLSGGQKGVLAMCFRSVLGEQFNADIGLLCLDEPTAGMDEANVGYLSDALSRYAARVRGRRQVIVITHADRLKSAFDQVVEVGVEGA